MPEGTLKPVSWRTALFVLLSALYVAWATRFIARSAVDTSEGRCYCLFDDAMVSLRYAWNLAHGHGLVWNPGERVEGTTSLFFTLLMASGALFFGKSGAALFVQIAGIALVLASAGLARKLLGALLGASHLGFIATAAVFAYYPLSYWSLMGMETGCLTVLALLALSLTMRLGSEPRGSRFLGVLLGLMFATRPDAAVAASFILACRALWIGMDHRRVDSLKPWLIEPLVFVGFVGALTLFRVAYYGSPVPNTYTLKMGNWPLYYRLRNGWRFISPFLDSSRYLLILAAGSAILKPERLRILLLGFVICVIACQVWVGGDAWTYWRLLVPGVVVMIVLAVDGSRNLIRKALRTERNWLVFGFSVACTGVALWVADEPFKDELRFAIPAYTVPMNGFRVAAGIELSHYADSDGTVAVFAAGALPYYSGLRGIDALGKSDPYIARLPGLGFNDGQTVTPGHNKFDLRYSILKLRPDVIYDALAWARYEKPEILDYVNQNYVPKGSFWIRRDSLHVHWDRITSR